MNYKNGHHHWKKNIGEIIETDDEKMSDFIHLQKDMERRGKRKR